MRLVIVVLVLLTVYLQYALWYTRGGIQDVEKLKISVAEQKDEIARLKERNRSLSAEVIDLKQGLEAVEERARSEMGMIKNGEVFFRITDPNHTHNGTRSGVGGVTNTLEPPLEPPLDPLAPGDGGAADRPPAPEVEDEQALPLKPLVKAAPKVTAKPAAQQAATPATPKVPLASQSKTAAKANAAPLPKSVPKPLARTASVPAAGGATPARKPAAFE